MKKIGLVFSGGGGKGAYEVGVWKALKEFGIDQYVGAVAGTSVGGLNASLLHQGDFAKADQVWRTISNDAILKVEKEAVLSKLTSMGFPTLGAAMAPLLTRFLNHGVFSQSGLEKLIRENLDLTAVSQSETPLTVCALNLSTKKTEYLKLNGRSEDEIVKCLLASAAIPFIFDKIEINGSSYVDGGVVPAMQDNSPIGAVVGEGCDLIISIMLDQTANTLDHELQNKDQHVWKIVPSQDLGGVFDGSLDFSPEGAARRLELGYQDAKNTLEKIAEFLAIENKFREKVSEWGEQAFSFSQQAKLNPVLREAIEKSHDQSQANLNTLQFLLEFKSQDRQHLSIAEAHTTEIELAEKQSLIDLLTAQEKELARQAIDQQIEDLHENSYALEKLAFEGITALAPVEHRVESFNKKGFFAKLWGTVTGSNFDVMNQNIHDLNKAIGCNQEMIKRLAERSMLTFDALISMNNHIAYLQTLHQNTQGQIQNIYASFGSLQNILGQLISDVNQKFAEVDSRLLALEQNQDLLFWHTALLGQSFKGVEYKSLPAAQKLTLVCCELFGKTNGQITNAHLPLLKSSLATLGLESQEEIPLEDFFNNFRNDPVFLEHCLEKSLAYERVFPVCEDQKAFTPMIADIESLAVSQGSQAEFALTKSSFLPEKLKAHDLAAEFLFNLRYSYKAEGSTSQERLLSSLKVCAEQLLPENSQRNLYEKIQEAKMSIEEYKIKVPLIGEFSAGKSALLNASLLKNRGQLLKVETSAETSLATELHYATRERCELHLLNGEVEECPLDQLESVKERAHEILFVKLFLNQAELRALGDVIPVDMPGLSSNLDAHDKAILNYIAEGTFYVVAISVEDGDLKANMKRFVNKELKSYGLNSSVLITKSDKRTSDEVESVRQKVAESVGNDVKVSTVTSVAPVNTQAFSQILSQVSGRKADFIQRKFEATVQSLLKETKAYFTRILKEDNLTAADLAREIEDLEAALPKLEKEFKDLLSDLEYALLNEGVEELYQRAISSLSSDALYHSAKAGSQQLQQAVSNIMRPLIVNGVKDIVERKLEDFERAVKKLSEKAGDSIAGNFSFAYTSAQSDNGSAMKSAMKGAAIGIIGGPMGVLIGGVIGFLKGKKNNEEEELLSQLNNQIVPQAHAQARQVIEQAFATAFKDLEATIQKDFEGRRDDHLNSLKDLQKDKEMNEEEHEKQREVWQESLQELHQAELSLSQLSSQGLLEGKDDPEQDLILAE